MYLTKLTLDLRSYEVRRDIADAYDMHRTLTRAFVSEDQPEPPRFLWRLEINRHFLENPVVLVQSRYPADWVFLTQLSHYLQCAAITKDISLDRFVQLNHNYCFRLLANPTICQEHKRRPLLRQNDQTDWMKRQADRFGFSIQSLLVSHCDFLNSYSKGNAPVSIHRVCFEGTLAVRNVGAVRQALVGGIGHAKAYGCGLLSIAHC
jgi:CRISPR system Cascade subunit CasE